MSATVSFRSLLTTQHITKYVKNWSKYEADWALWDPNRKAELERLVEKRPNLVYFDVYVRAYDKVSPDVSKKRCF